MFTSRAAPRVSSLSRAAALDGVVTRRSFLLRTQLPHRQWRKNSTESAARATKNRGPQLALTTLWIGLGLGLGWLAADFNRTGATRTSTAAESDSAISSTTSLSEMPVVRYNLKEANIKAAEKEFVALLGSDRVTADLGERIAHSSTEWSPAPNGDLDRHSLIVYPLTTEEVSSIAKICHRRRIPVIPFSGGTSLEGTLAATTQGGVCIDFSRMNKILQLHKHDLDVVVQPGIGYEQLNEELARQGLYFPPDPGPGAQIGGMIGQGCSGTNAYRYGAMKDWVLGLTVVMMDGTVVKTRHRPRKSSAGYNLTQLVVASEGTIGIVTEASLKLTGKPENERVAVAAFPTTHKAIEAAVAIVRSGLPIAAMELLDTVTMEAVNRAGYCNKEYANVPTIFFKFAGPVETVKQQILQITNISKQSKCKSFEVSTSDEDASALWAARKTALWSLLAIKEDPGDKFLSADACVPISRLADIIEDTNAKIKEAGFVGSCLGHVGDGNQQQSSLA